MGGATGLRLRYLGRAPYTTLTIVREREWGKRWKGRTWG
jgi:hypothetical protein